MKPVYLKPGSILKKFMIVHEFNYYLNQISENELILISKLIPNHYKIKNLSNSDELLKDGFFLLNNYPKK